MNKIELIDRVAVIEGLEFSKTIRHMQTNVPLIDEFIGILNDLPTIDAAPVRRGEWVMKPTGRYRAMQAWCSMCGKHSGIGGIESNQRKPFCPNCGADMRRVAIHEPED